MLSNFILSAILVICVFIYIKFCINRFKFYKLVDKIPGPPRFPIPGIEGISLLKDLFGKNNQEIFEYLIEISKKYDTTSKFWIGHMCGIIVQKPNDLQILFNSPNALEKSNFYKSIPLHKGMVVGPVDLWRSHRKKVNPAFNYNTIKAFTPIFNEKSKLLVSVLNEKVNQGEFDMFHYLSTCTLESLLATIMRYQRNYIKNPQDNFWEMCRVAQVYMGQKFFKVWLHYKPILSLTKYNKIENNIILNGVFKIADSIYNTNLNDLNNMQIKDNFDESSYKRQKVFIDIILENKDLFTKEEIKDEINTMLFAGFDTSALTMAVTCLMLAMHPEIQAKVVGELKENFTSASEDFNVDTFNSLPYLENVIKECLRLFPVLPLLGRATTGEVQLESCTLPAGCDIMIPTFITQRNKLYWGEDAEIFNPDRFLPENIEKVHPYAFIPFSAGQRVCIGMRYGMNVMKVVLSHILRNFELSTSLKYNDLTYEFALTLRIAQNYMIQLKKREF